MGTYHDLIAKGVYCKSCGCFTNKEPGHPIKCEKCTKKNDHSAK